MKKAAFLPLLLCAAMPAYTQSVPTAPAAAQAAPVDPARFALARSIVLKIAPDGTYRRLMKGSLDQIMGGMTNQMMSMPIRQFLSGTNIPQDQIAKLNNVSIRDIMALLDPAFDQRMHVTMSIMMSSMTDVLSSYEPQMREGMAEAYARNFTLAQLTEVDHFFSTPTGSAYASRMMTIMNDPAVKSRMEGLMPAIMQAIPKAGQQVEAATASLPKPKKIEDLSDADRARLAKLLGVDPTELKKAKTQ